MRNVTLFGALVLALALSKSWTQTAGVANAADLASTDPMASATVLDTQSFSIDVPYKDKAGVNRNMTVQANVRSVRVTETTGTTVDAEGHFQTQQQTKRKVQVSFTSDLCNSSAGCVPDATFDAETSNFNLLASLANYLGPVVQASYNKNQQAAKELAEKRGDLAKRKKQADECKIKIVDENDQSKDLKLSRSENLEERLSCKAEKFNAMDFDDDDNGRRKMAAFKRLFGDDITKLAHSSDADTRAEASSVLSDLADQFEDEDIADYVNRTSAIAEDYNFALENAQILADKDHRDPQEVLQAGAQLNQGYQYYNGSSTAVLNARLRSGNLSYGDVQAIADLRGTMVETLRAAITNPSQLLGSSFQTLQDGTTVPGSTTGSRVSGRTQIGTAMPRYTPGQINGVNGQLPMRAGQAGPIGTTTPGMIVPGQPRTRTGTVDPRNYPASMIPR